MNKIQKDNFTFLVDIEKTRKYYTSNTLCDCCYCRNLYAQIDSICPELTGFLTEFGIDILRPDDATSIEIDNHIDYISVGYTVSGTIKTEGFFHKDIENYHITISNGNKANVWFPNEQTEPCFFVSVTGITLPWVLDEPYPHKFSDRIIDKINRLFTKICKI